MPLPAVNRQECSKLLVCLVGSLSQAVDVYAFGVVLWEMYTAQRPWAGMRQAQIVHTVCTLGHQLEFPYGTPNRFEVTN